MICDVVDVYWSNVETLAFCEGTFFLPVFWVLWLFAIIILFDVVIGGLYYPATIYLDALIFLFLVFDVVTLETFFSTEVALFRAAAVKVLGSSSFEIELLEWSAA